MNELNSNQIILLLDIFRGAFDPHRHPNLVLDAQALQNSRLIEPDKDSDRDLRRWKLTPNGDALVSHILTQACWRLEFVAGPLDA